VSRLLDVQVANLSGPVAALVDARDVPRDKVLRNKTAVANERLNCRSEYVAIGASKVHSIVVAKGEGDVEEKLIRQFGDMVCHGGELSWLAISKDCAVSASGVLWSARLG